MVVVVVVVHRGVCVVCAGCLVAEQGGVVPSQLCELSSLTRLHLAKNRLTALPPLFGLLSNLAVRRPRHRPACSLYACVLCRVPRVL